MIGLLIAAKSIEYKQFHDRKDFQVMCIYFTGAAESCTCCGALRKLSS